MAASALSVFDTRTSNFAQSNVGSGIELNERGPIQVSISGLIFSEVSRAPGAISFTPPVLAGVQSDHPTHLAQRERIIEGMRKAGVPED